jgi:hypothetical protein
MPYCVQFIGGVRTTDCGLGRLGHGWLLEPWLVSAMAVSPLESTSALELLMVVSPFESLGALASLSYESSSELVSAENEGPNSGSGFVRILPDVSASAKAVGSATARSLICWSV